MDRNKILQSKTFKIKKFGENLQSISQKMKKYSFSDRTQGGQILILQRAKSVLEKGQRSFRGQQVLFGTKFLKFGPKRVNVATLCCTTSLTTAELRHMHYNIVCDITNRTAFIMSSHCMI